jgi:hypothetical protein
MERQRKKPLHPPVYQLKITLRDIRPPIWRRVLVPAAMRLSHLHEVFQIAMGWTDSHLHQFEKDGARYGLPDDEFSGIDVFDDTVAALDQLLKAKGDLLLYVYDFGDNWRHDVLLEEILPGQGATDRPVCIAGERNCPPEDVGGIGGYEQFLEVIFDPAHEDHERIVRWAGGRFQAEEFKLAAVNKYLSRLRRPTRRRS